MSASTTRAVTCGYHCSGCHRHFASLQAFEAHRQGTYRDGARHCVAPEKVKKLVAKSEDGRCDIGHAHPVAGVTVWQTLAAAGAKGWA